HRCQVGSEISSCLHTSTRAAPWPISFSPSRSLRMICSGVCRRLVPIVIAPPSPIMGHRALTTGGPLHGDLVRCSCLVVVPDRGGHGQEALGHSHGDAGEGASAVLFQVELAFEGVVDRLDELADLFEHRLAVAGFLLLA